uniref:Uncharacterized protein n=1 Tax=Branchiostoma floridae TaxID=7739 RepID=C3YVV8_BRAFL|eukprot:XP_002599630.1 hypothetical protein BRAFLDRAFT_102572 [Branchiostoma floridae]
MRSNLVILKSEERLDISHFCFFLYEETNFLKAETNSKREEDFYYESPPQTTCYDVPRVATNRHIPSTDPPSSMRDGLKRNPMYKPNVLQQACCQCTYRGLSVAVIVTTLLAASVGFGTWIYSHNNVRDVQKTREDVYNTSNPGQPALDSTYTDGQPTLDTAYIHGRYAADTTFTHGQPAVDIAYSIDTPVTDTTYIPGHPAVCSEEYLSEILERYLKYNAHAGSYTWKYDGKNLDMGMTLEENEIFDES